MVNQFLIEDILDTGDLKKIRDFIHNTEGARETRMGSLSDSWLHYAASYTTPDVIKLLHEEGFDINDAKNREGDKPITGAASKGHLNNVKMLLELGADLDTDLSVRNPLFSTIVGRGMMGAFPTIFTGDILATAQLLLDHGIDATVRYNSDTMIEMDAMAFALWRGQKEIAIIIAKHLAKDNRVEMHRLLEDAERRVALNGPLEGVRLVPTLEELETMQWDEDGNLLL